MALIDNFEGCKYKLTAYQNSMGAWTIGYGHTSGADADEFIVSGATIPVGTRCGIPRRGTVVLRRTGLT